MVPDARSGHAPRQATSSQATCVSAAIAWSGHDLHIRAECGAGTVVRTWLLTLRVCWEWDW